MMMVWMRRPASYEVSYGWRQSQIWRRDFLPYDDDDYSWQAAALMLETAGSAEHRSFNRIR